MKEKIIFDSQNVVEKTTREMYVQLAKKFHPDVGGNPELMIQLNEAYEEAKSGNTESLVRMYDKLYHQPQTSERLSKDILIIFDELFAGIHRMNPANDHERKFKILFMDKVRRAAENYLETKNTAPVMEAHREWQGIKKIWNIS